GVFVCFSELPRTDLDADTLRAYAHASFDLLADAHELGHVRRHVDRCFDALPSAAHAPYVGMMFGRARAQARVCLSNVRASELVAYLHRVRWPGDGSVVDELIGALAAHQIPGPLRGPGIVHLDLEPQGITRVGLEFGLQRPPQARGVVREHELFDEL